MSAYMVDRDCIKYLVTAANTIKGGYGQGDKASYYWQEEHKKINDREEATRIGQMLWDANRASIEARYPDTVGKPDRMPGPVGEQFIYVHNADWTGPIDTVQVLMTLRCFSYQSCEDSKWEQSEAFAFCEGLKDWAIRHLPGMDKAEWGAPKHLARV